MGSGLGQAIGLTTSSTWAQLVEKIKSIVNHGAVNQELSAGGSYTIPQGYHSGGKITAKSLASQTDATATAAQILAGITAWIKGVKVTGTMAERGNLNWKPTGSTTYSVPEGHYTGGTLDSSAAYNAGVTAADNRANTNSVNYKTGYNAGVAAADNRVNTNSTNYKSGYNAGVAAGRTLKSKTYTVTGSSDKYSWTNTGGGKDSCNKLTINTGLGTHTICAGYWISGNNYWLLAANGLCTYGGKQTFTKMETGPTGAGWATADTLVLPCGGEKTFTVTLWYV